MLKILAAGWAHKAVFWPSQGLNDGTLNNFRFSTEGRTLVSKSFVVPHHRVVTTRDDAMTHTYEIWNTVHGTLNQSSGYFCMTEDQANEMSNVNHWLSMSVCRSNQSETQDFRQSMKWPAMYLKACDPLGRSIGFKPTQAINLFSLCPLQTQFKI